MFLFGPWHCPRPGCYALDALDLNSNPPQSQPRPPTGAALDSPSSGCKARTRIVECSPAMGPWEVGS